MWTQWTPGDCSVTCGHGVRTRTRGCEDYYSGEQLDPSFDCGAVRPEEYSHTEKCDTKNPCAGMKYQIT